MSSSLKLIYTKNNIRTSNSSYHINNEIVWNEFRESLLDLIAKFNTDLSKSTFSKRIQINGMSTWWINRLTAKHSLSNQSFIPRLQVVYLLRTGHFHQLITDDIIIYKIVKKLFPDINVTLNLSSFFNILNKYFTKTIICIGMIKSFTRDVLNVLLFKTVPKQKIDYSTKKVAFFKSLFPVNWIYSDSTPKYDRMLFDISEYKNNLNIESIYLIFFQTYSSNPLSRLVLNRKKIINLSNTFRCVFCHQFISLKEVASLYFSSLIEFYNLILFSRKSSRQKFIFYGMDISDICYHEWLLSYSGDIQFNLIHSVSCNNAINTIVSDKKIVVIYGELNAQNRYLYHLLYHTSNVTSFAIQHSVNSEYKLFSNYRTDEINIDSNDHIKYMPVPDYFLSHGDQYTSILKRFYPEYRTINLGCLKYINFNTLERSEHVRNYLNLDLKNKVILISPSIDDGIDILYFFREVIIPHDWRIILSPHPSGNLSVIKKFIWDNLSHLNISINTHFPTSILLPHVDLVVSSYSSIPIEACFFGVPSVRLVNPFKFPQFDFDERIPVFYNTEDFNKWFHCFDANNNNTISKSQLTKLFYHYFCSIDKEIISQFYEIINHKC